MPTASGSDIYSKHQTLRLSAPRLASLREWATEGSGLSAAARVTDSDGRILMVKNSWSTGWFFPGGAVEPAERPADAAQREVFEETGLDATIEDELAVLKQDFVSKETGHHQFSGYYILYAAHAEGTVSPRTDLGVAEDEIRDADWFVTPPEQIHEREFVLNFWPS